MEENKKNENLQSRREFFKKAAKGDSHARVYATCFPMIAFLIA